jgi:hypothetical protein
MFKEDKMIEAIRWILNLYEPSDYDAFDEKELGSDYGLCMSEVVMALRNKAQTVYQYRIDSNYEKGLSYRGAELFNQRAILIHLENESVTFTNETTTRYNTELWLLENMSFAIVHFVNMLHNDGIAYETEYRALVKRLENRDDLFFPPEDLIEELEEACIPIWESEAIIYEL